MLDFEIISIKRSENSPLKRCYMDYDIFSTREKSLHAAGLTNDKYKCPGHGMLFEGL